MPVPLLNLIIGLKIFLLPGFWQTLSQSPVCPWFWRSPHSGTSQWWSGGRTCPLSPGSSHSPPSRHCPRPCWWSWTWRWWSSRSEQPYLGLVHWPGNILVFSFLSSNFKFYIQSFGSFEIQFNVLWPDLQVDLCLMPIVVHCTQSGCSWREGERSCVHSSFSAIWWGTDQVWLRPWRFFWVIKLQC